MQTLSPWYLIATAASSSSQLCARYAGEAEDLTRTIFLDRLRQRAHRMAVSFKLDLSANRSRSVGTTRVPIASMACMSFA